MLIRRTLRLGTQAAASADSASTLQSSATGTVPASEGSLKAKMPRVATSAVPMTGPMAAPMMSGSAARIRTADARKLR
jgi:hypothetical protein